MKSIHVSAICALTLVFFAPTARAQEPLPVPLWAVDASGNSWAVSVATGPDSDPVVTGGTCPATGGDCDLRTIKYNSRNGNVIWDISSNGLLTPSSQDDPGGVAVGHDDNVLVVGTGCDAANCKLVALSYSDRGSLLWHTTYGSGLGRFVGADVAIGDRRDAYAVGASCPTDVSCSWLVLKIDQDTGEVLWSVTLEDGAGFDRAFGVVATDNGDAIVTGSSCQPLSEQCNFRTMRLAERDGAVLWSRTADSGEDEERLGELGFDVAIDGDDNVVVSGVTCRVTTSCDFRVVKRDSRTGEILWTTTRSTVVGGVEQYDGGLGSDIYVDNHGDPIIVGQSCNPDDLTDCRPKIFKLRGGNGDFVWELTGSPSDRVALQGVTVGLDGNPTATGFVTAGTATSMRTTKYAIVEPTPTGAPVPTSLNGGADQPGGVSLTFDSVTTAGTTTLVSGSEGPPPPAGFGFMGTPPTYFDIVTTATFSGPITICVNFSSFPVNTPVDELRLFHHENGAWRDVTTSVDPVAQKVCGASSSLSPFAIGERGSAVRSIGPAQLSLATRAPGASRIRFDVRVEVYRGGNQLIGAGQLDSVAAKGVVGLGFERYSVPISARGSYVLPSGSALTVKVLVRNACTGSRAPKGEATLLYDSVVLGSRFLLRTRTQAIYFLRTGFALGTQAPSPTALRAATLSLGAPCGPFQSFGSWTTTLP